MPADLASKAWLFAETLAKATGPFGGKETPNAGYPSRPWLCMGSAPSTFRRGPGRQTGQRLLDPPRVRRRLLTFVGMMPLSGPARAWSRAVPSSSISPAGSQHLTAQQYPIRISVSSSDRLRG